MDDSMPCPSIAALRDHVLGRLSSSQRKAIQAHLLLCGPCRRRVENLETEVLSFAEDGPGDTGGVVPVGAESGHTTEHVAASDPLEATLELDFLTPSSQGGSLGRLGEYEILNLLGEGGMGIVFRAFDETLHRVVALKVLAPALAASQKARRRFVREARAVAGINHPNIVTIHSVGIEDQLPYLVMEYLSGGTLRQRIKSGPPLTMAEILRVGTQVAAGLAAAHEQGVIHRDIKPANIMLEESVDRVKITDFGLALAALDRSGITSAGQVIGTPSYMCPEQIDGKAVDARGDLFSLGCVLYAMVTGQSPFQGAHSLEVIRRVCDTTPRPLVEVDGRIPRELSRLVERLLEKDPRNRPQTAREVAGLLTQQLARANRIASNSAPELETILVEPLTPHRRGHWVMAIPAACLCLAALAVASLLIVRMPRHDPPPRGPERHETAAPALKAPALRPLVTVARSRAADVQSLTQALEWVAPGGTIRVLDDARYEGSVAIDDRERWQGLTLEARHGALIIASEGTPALTIRDVPGVTVRGFRLRATPGEHALLVDGTVQCTTLEDLKLAQLGASRHRFATARFSVDPPASPGDGIVVRHCRFENLGLGVAVLDPASSARRVGGIQFRENEFAGSGVHLLIAGSAEGIQVTGNRFLGGKNGVNLNFSEPDVAREVLIANNTFFGTTFWLGLVKTVAPQKQITVCNNLILDSRKVEWGWAGQVDEVARVWDFHHNWWEPSVRTETGEQTKPPVAEFHRDIALWSRQPDSPDFLRPAANSALATAGGGAGFPSYIGAVAP